MMANQSFTSIDKPVLILVGPTAIGKTGLSLELAELFHCEIVSVDSMQVYRFMDIGTAKASPQERAQVVHHLIDIVNPDEEYDAARFAEDAVIAVNTIHAKGKIPLLTGGTGLYLRALLEGLAPGIGQFSEIRQQLQQQLQDYGANKLHEQLARYDQLSAERICVNDTHRLLRAMEIYLGTGKPWSVHISEQHEKKQNRFTNILLIGLRCERTMLYRRIDTRASNMLRNGLEEEVRGLLARGFGADCKSMQSIGYRHMNSYLQNNWDFQEMERLLARDTRHYAKRQYTWFSTLQGLEWFDVQNHVPIQERIQGWLAS
jgi:tRNA dimethylallyltransferase